jgi:hypothetical protein
MVPSTRILVQIISRVPTAEKAFRTISVAPGKAPQKNEQRRISRPPDLK